MSLFTHPHVVPNIYAFYFCLTQLFFLLQRKYRKYPNIIKVYHVTCTFQVFWRHQLALCDNQRPKFSKSLIMFFSNLAIKSGPGLMWWIHDNQWCLVFWASVEGSISSDFEIDRCVYYELHEILIFYHKKKKNSGRVWNDMRVMSW